jgi:4-amino-4-deoxy-L-arabinose transferase-like glycosyltransferase
MAAVCASIRVVSARLSDTAEKLSGSESRGHLQMKLETSGHDNGTARSTLLAFGLACALLTLAAILFRPLTPTDEGRYVSVAWEMWNSGEFISLTLNGELYGHKPPLLFWLINAGWAVFGVNEWWPRVFVGLFGVGALALVLRIAGRLAGDRPALATMTAAITVSTLFWMVFTGAVMFDLMLAFFVLLGIDAVLQAAQRPGPGPWAMAGFAVGLGILTKGPVALLHVLPVALLAPMWLPQLVAAGVAPRVRWGRWYGGVALALLLAAAVALSWAMPSALAGGKEFGREIFWSQTVDRIATTVHHLRPLWFYAATLPLLLLPWLFFPAVWRGLAAALRAPSSRPPGWAFALAWVAPVFLAFSAFRGKQIQYLLPAVPGLAFLLAAGLASLGRPLRRWETWTPALLFALLAAALLLLNRHPKVLQVVEADEIGTVAWTSAALVAAGAALCLAPWRDATRHTLAVAAATVFVMLGVYAGFGRALFDAYDVHAVSAHLRAVQAAGQPVAHLGKYQGQFQFIGRLREPLAVIESPAQLRPWLEQHPQGRVVIYTRAKNPTQLQPPPEFAQKFKGRQVGVWRASDLLGVSVQWLESQDRPQ